MSLGPNRRMVLTGLATGLSTVLTNRKGGAQDSRTKIRIGIVPLISTGPIYIAQARGYFQKIGLDVEFLSFADGALAIPALIAGEIDVTGTTLNAALFNAISKKAPYRLILDRGSEKPGSGSLQIAVSNAILHAGLNQPKDMGLVKGKADFSSGAGRNRSVPYRHRPAARRPQSTV
jgi:NitT/TauT family transport system substrate-binding protein